MKRSMDQAVLVAASKLFESIDTPISLGIYLRMKYELWEDIAGLRISPMAYLDTVTGAKKFALDYQAVSYLRKYDGLPIKGQDLLKKAKDAFFESERGNKLTNMRLSILEHPIGVHPTILGVLHKTRKHMEKILGPLPQFLEGKFGPGTLFEFSRGHGVVYRNIAGKLTSAIHCTPASTAIVENTVRPTWWFRSLCAGDPSDTAFRIVPGNRFTTAPKDALNLRGICVEAGGNMFAQLGVGKHIRRRLFTSAGIDLDHGQAHHDQMARRGSITNGDATIDVRTASDTVARMCVKLLLAYCGDWFLLLDCLRSPKTRVDGRWVWLEKFSSMGNGFTFELETAIFYCLALAACGRQVGDPRVKVYGDDIIVPADEAEKVLSLLTVFGFEPNMRKTYLTGPFRESCGGDYFCGFRVTPVYLKEEPKQPSDWIAMANGLYSLGKIGFKACMHARDQIPRKVKCYGPEELGDIVLHERDPERWSSRWCENGIRWITTWQPIQLKIRLNRYPPTVMLASALYGVDSSGVSPPDSIIGFKHREVAFS